MNITRHTVSITTDASGNAVVNDCDEALPLNGLLLSISYKPDGSVPLATGADLVVTEYISGLAVYAQNDIGTTAFTKLPRKAICSSADGVDSTTNFDMLPVVGRLIFTIASGGNAKKGTFYLMIAQ